MLTTIINWIVNNRKTVFKASLGLCVAFLLAYGVILHKQNKQLSERLEAAQSNIEAYQGIVSDSQQANRVLQLTIDQLQNSNDSVIQKLDSVRKELKIKPKEITTVATQTQYIYVSDSKGVGGQILVNDTIYTDSLEFNPYTKVHYTIGNDTISMALDIKNTQFFFIYNKKEYKNNKSFIKRLFTLDFKKVNRYQYKIHNTNELINTDDVRVIETITK